MLTVYPSNRLEDLAVLLHALLKRSDVGVLESQSLLVESQGMKHWLSMQLAQLQGIAMNLSFPMPQRFIWEQARQILGEDVVPKDSPYKREVLSWRIDQLLSSDAFMDSELAVSVTQYWNQQQTDELMRYQLAGRVGDLFEQYMMFRPQWLTAWEHGQSIAADYGLDPETEQWQAWLWRALLAEQAIHPVLLQQQALASLASQAPECLPKQIYIFAINTLAPQSMAFIEAIAKHCQVHLFHLNPCVSFWGDIQSDKRLAQQARQQQAQDWERGAELRNPLLANLGAQGRDFFNLLQSLDTFEISAFAEEAYASDPSLPVSVLQQIQADILQLRNAEHEPQHLFDESIVFSSSHSALREIQSLHDYLLHQFNQPELNLRPQDVLVMCPAIEDYAPYIDAVFRRPWEVESASSPKLPCSIADRSLSDSEPLIAAFLSLLQLPDSRFEVRKVCEYLRLPAIQHKFGLLEADLETIEWWLDQACVHWGLNAQHKQQLTDVSDSSALFSWEWGLKRLLLGYAHGDSEEMLDDLLLLPHVEGQQGLLLGRLMHLLESLQGQIKQLTHPRKIQQWHTDLLAICDALFAPEAAGEDTLLQIYSVINNLLEHVELADYQQDLSLAVIRHYLNQHFALPDAANNFMTGQVTFCSMMPMRSIPFKVIAVLGMNDGHYPRQSTPISFDLMAQSPVQAGDRSRRGDDRYLFLEALISARHSLYLSYQGRAIKDNVERQPSLILRELMAYLQQGYGWRFSGDGCEGDGLQQQSLHPFSEANFHSPKASFDQAWLRLAHRSPERNNLIECDMNVQRHLTLDELCRFFDDPLRQFAHHALGLNLQVQQQLPEDAEPFDASNLVRYQMDHTMTAALLEHTDPSSLGERFRLAGLLPDNAMADQVIAKSMEHAQLLSAALEPLGPLQLETASFTLHGFELSAQYYCNPQGEIIVYRSGARRGIDDLRLYLLRSLVSVAKQGPIVVKGVFLEKVYNSELKQVKTYHMPAEPDTELLAQRLAIYLDFYQQGLRQALLIHASLGKKLFEKGAKKLSLPLCVDQSWSQVWSQVLLDQNDFRSLVHNAYYRWFYAEPPVLEQAHLEHLAALYLPLYQALAEVK